MEERLLPKIEEAGRRAEAVAVPLVVAELVDGAGSEAEIRARWEARPVTVHREVHRALFAEISLNPAAAGAESAGW